MNQTLSQKLSMRDRNAIAMIKHSYETPPKAAPTMSEWSYRLTKAFRPAWLFLTDERNVSTFLLFCDERVFCNESDLTFIEDKAVWCTQNNLDRWLWALCASGIYFHSGFSWHLSEYGNHIRQSWNDSLDPLLKNFERNNLIDDELENAWQIIRSDSGRTFLEFFSQFESGFKFSELKISPEWPTSSALPNDVMQIFGAAILVGALSFTSACNWSLTLFGHYLLSHD